MIAHHAEAGNAPSLTALADQLLGFVRHAADQGRPAHDVERAIWDRVLKLGREAFALFLRLHGTGDAGDQLTPPDGSTADRLPTTHARGYRSVFGDFTPARTCYGTRDGQRIAFVPLGDRPQLPGGDYSHPLQEWGATGALTWALAESAGTTTVTLSYGVGGYIEGGFEHIAPLVEQVLGTQLARLRRFVETGRPD